MLLLNDYYDVPLRYTFGLPLIAFAAACTKLPLVGRYVHQGISRVCTQGPSEGAAASIKGFTAVTVFGTAADGATSRVTMRCDADPGVALTALLACESAALLASDARAGLPKRYGFLTPAMAFGDAIIAPLKKAGVVWREELSSPVGGKAKL